MTRTPIDDRCSIEVHLEAEDLRQALCRDVLAGLTAVPKSLPPKWFYDERGSQLFDEITRLREYYPTRTETQILQHHVATIARRTGATRLLELGSGTSTKTKFILDALMAAGTLTHIVPFDVCEAIVQEAVPVLAARYPGVRVDGIVGDFEQHLGRLEMGDHTLVAFLGGTIGNLIPVERAKFLNELVDQMHSGDWLLLGTDLVKDPARLVAAYDDAAGVTAAFNVNVLRVLNRELDGNLVVEQFEHVARWRPEEQWIEMHLRSRQMQEVRLGALGLDLVFAAGEHIQTEISAKFTLGGIGNELGAAGLTLDEVFTDDAKDFAVSLAFKP